MSEEKRPAMGVGRSSMWGRGEQPHFDVPSAGHSERYNMTSRFRPVILLCQLRLALSAGVDPVGSSIAD
jgi:hypothetical protein